MLTPAIRAMVLCSPAPQGARLRRPISSLRPETQDSRRAHEWCRRIAGSGDRGPLESESLPVKPDGPQPGLIKDFCTDRLRTSAVRPYHGALPLLPRYSIMATKAY